MSAQTPSIRADEFRPQFLKSTGRCLGGITREDGVEVEVGTRDLESKDRVLSDLQEEVFSLFKEIPWAPTEIDK
jgi:hypothetical protein